MARYFATIVTGIAATTLVLTPALASAAPARNPAAALSTGKAVRAGSGIRTANHLAGVPGTTLINIGILAALTVGVLVAVDSGGDDSADSN